MGCLAEAARQVRSRLTWRVSVLDGEGDRVEAWSNPATRSHTIMLPPDGERDYNLLHGMILAEFAETLPPLVTSNTIWGVSIASQNLVRAFYLAMARDWFVTGRIAAFDGRGVRHMHELVNIGTGIRAATATYASLHVDLSRRKVAVVSDPEVLAALRTLAAAHGAEDVFRTRSGP